MRRKDKEVTERARLEDILAQAQVGRLAMVAEEEGGASPYLIPVFFAGSGDKLYVHCAQEGRKLELLAANPRVCVEVDECRGIFPADKPCAFSSVFRSVIAFGAARRVEDTALKRAALDLLMRKYAGRATGPGFEFSDATLEHTVILEITVQAITGKQSKNWEEWSQK